MRIGRAIAAVFAILLLAFSVVRTAAQAQQCDHAQAVLDVQKLKDTHTIVSVDRFPPYVTVVIDDRRWDSADPNGKKMIAATVDCATAEPGSPMLRTVVFRSNRDNRVLGEYSQNELKLR